MTTSAQPKEISEKVDLWLRMYRQILPNKSRAKAIGGPRKYSARF